MNDDTFDPRHELASAYLDDEATSDERARLEDAPELLALAEEYARVRAALADVEPASADARERAVSVALAEFDRLHAPATVATGGGTVVRLGGWSTWRWRVLSGAAAAAVVALVGMVVLSGGRSTDDLSTTEVSDDAARTLDAPLMTAVPEAAGDEPRPTIGGIFGPAEAVLVISTPDELLAYASIERDVTPPPKGADSTPDTGAATTRADLPCVTEGTVGLGEVVYLETPAVVVRDLATGAVRALDTGTCAVLVEVEP